MNAASKKILIADDDSSIRLVLSQAFTRLGYQVRATGNAATLLKWVTDGEGDLVVTDVVMPDENVFDVLPRIRKQRPRLPVIVMSAQNNLITAVNAAEVGAFEYVPKPFDLDDMTSAARRALSRPADAPLYRGQGFGRFSWLVCWLISWALTQASNGSCDSCSPRSASMVARSSRRRSSLRCSSSMGVGISGSNLTIRLGAPAMHRSLMWRQCGKAAGWAALRAR